MECRLVRALLTGAALPSGALVLARTAVAVLSPRRIHVGGIATLFAVVAFLTLGMGSATAGATNGAVASTHRPDLPAGVGNPSVVACTPGAITLIQSPGLSVNSLVVTAPITSTGGSWASCGGSITYFYYEWLSDGAVISGPTLVNSPPTSFTRLIAFGDAGHTIRSAVNPCNAEGCYGTYVQSSNGVAVPAFAPTMVNGASFVSQSVPSTLLACQTAPVSVTMSNSGSTVWGAAGLYRLGSQNPQDNQTWGVQRVELPSGAFPGNPTTFSFTITAPCTPGTYNFQWRMVQDGVQWFGDYTPNVQVTVTSPDPTTGDQACTMFPNLPGCDVWFGDEEHELGDCSTLTPTLNLNSDVVCDPVSNWDTVTTGSCPHDFPNCKCPSPSNAKRLVIDKNHFKTKGTHVDIMWFGMRVFWCSSGATGNGRITRIYVNFDHDVTLLGSIDWQWKGLDSTSCDGNGANHCSEQAGSALHPVTEVTLSARGTFQQCLTVRYLLCHDKRLGVWVRIHRNMSVERGNL
jgi:hypothetical protein